MLRRAAVKVGLQEPKKKFLDMTACLKSYGTRTIHLIHVRTKSRYLYREKLEIRLSELSAEISAQGFEVFSHIQNGHAPTLTVAMAQELEVDYLCLYWQPKGLLSQALLGSIDSDILRICNLPVFIYKPRLFSVPRIKNVLYATDFKSTDAVALPYLMDRRFKAETLYILHVGHRAPDPATEAERRKKILNALHGLARQCFHAYEHVRVIETIGLSRKQIVRQAGANNVDLIVVGKSEHPDAVSRFMGSTAEILPHKTSCSVFVIPSICGLPHLQDHRDGAP
jgi:nucleotide-binding universal stress UspA family protein